MKTFLRLLRGNLAGFLFYAIGGVLFAVLFNHFLSQQIFTISKPFNFYMVGNGYCDQNDSQERANCVLIALIYNYKVADKTLKKINPTTQYICQNKKIDKKIMELCKALIIQDLEHHGYDNLLKPNQWYQLPENRKDT